MAADRTKVLQQAQLLTTRGQYDAAIAEWKKLALDAPNDGSIYNSIGDLHLKRNSQAEATGAFLQAAAAFRAEGATLKAIAAYKKVLKIDPSRYEVYRHLGDLNSERGLLSSAVQDYLTLGKYYLKERKGKEALEIYKKIVSQDPSNLDAQQRVAELCIQENLQDEATKVYLQLGRERSAQGRYDEAKDAYLAALRIDPTNNEAAQFVESVEKRGTGLPKPVNKGGSAPVSKPSEPLDLLAEATRRIQEKQYAGAEAMLNQMLTREPGNPQVCRLLARLHLDRGDHQVALGEYRFLAGAALRAEDYGLAESLISEFLFVQPNSVPILELYGELYEVKGDSGAAAQQYAKAMELLLEHPESGMETLHEELFEKVKSLSTDAALVDRLAAKLRGESVDLSSQSKTHTTAVDVEEVAPGRVSASTAAEGFSVAGAEPDEDAWKTKSKTRIEQHGHLPLDNAQPDGIQAPITSESAVPVAADHDAHFTLGVAYKNMGLYAEAKEEFDVSKTGDAYYLDSCLMAALCYKEERQLAQAIRGLEAVLSDPRCKGAKSQAIRYELGLLYEAEAQWEKAANTFKSIPSFHDVPQRLESLKGRHQSAQTASRLAR